MKRNTMTRLLRNNEGSTIIEFAIIAPIFFLLMMGIIEFGMYMVTQVTIESAVGQAGRVAAVGSGVVPEADLVKQVKKTMEDKVSGLPRGRASIQITVNNVNKGGTRVPDLCLINGTDGVPESGSSCPNGVAFIDNNGNGSYDGNGGVTLGQPGDLIEVRATYPYRVFFPLFKPFLAAKDKTGSSLTIISSSTVIKNEPNSK